MTGSVAIVTGASSGIGQATALRLAHGAGAVVLVARNREKLAETARRIETLGAQALIADADLAQPDAARRVVQLALQRCGRIDALLNIAGAVPGIDLFQMSDEQWNDGMELKFHGARRLTIHAWDALKASGGAVVFTSGNAAMAPRAGAAAVGAINAAIEALAKAFAERGIADGVRVNSVSPGATMTGRRLAMLEKAAALQQVGVDQAGEQFLRQAGIRRFGTVEEIADAMAFAVAPASRWMTGTVLRIDGGEVKSV